MLDGNETRQSGLGDVDPDNGGYGYRNPWVTNDETNEGNNSQLMNEGGDDSSAEWYGQEGLDTTVDADDKKKGFKDGVDDNMQGEKKKNTVEFLRNNKAVMAAIAIFTAISVCFAVNAKHNKEKDANGEESTKKVSKAFSSKEDGELESNMKMKVFPNGFHYFEGAFSPNSSIRDRSLDFTNQLQKYFGDEKGYIETSLQLCAGRPDMAVATFCDLSEESQDSLAGISPNDLLEMMRNDENGGQIQDMVEKTVAEDMERSQVKFYTVGTKEADEVGLTVGKTMLNGREIYNDGSDDDPASVQYGFSEIELKEGDQLIVIYHADGTVSVRKRLCDNPEFGVEDKEFLEDNGYKEVKEEEEDITTTMVPMYPSEELRTIETTTGSVTIIPSLTDPTEAPVVVVRKDTDKFNEVQSKIDQGIGKQGDTGGVSVHFAPKETPTAGVDEGGPSGSSGGATTNVTETMKPKTERPATYGTEETTKMNDNASIAESVTGAFDSAQVDPIIHNYNVTPNNDAQKAADTRAATEVVESDVDDIMNVFGFD